jgi:hypothetical protein
MLQLIADRRADEIGSIGVKSFGDHEIDPAKVHKTEVDRDFLALAGFIELSSRHFAPSLHHPYGWNVGVTSSIASAVSRELILSRDESAPSVAQAMNAENQSGGS